MRGQTTLPWETCGVCGIMRARRDDTSYGDDLTKHSYRKLQGYMGVGMSSNYSFLFSVFQILNTILSVYSKLRVNPTALDPWQFFQHNVVNATYKRVIFASSLEYRGRADSLPGRVRKVFFWMAELYSRFWRTCSGEWKENSEQWQQGMPISQDMRAWQVWQTMGCLESLKCHVCVSVCLCVFGGG